MKRNVLLKSILGLATTVALLLVSCGGGGGGGGGGGSDDTCKNYTAVATVPSLWTQLSPAGTPPAARNQHEFAYDAANDRLIIHGGRDTTQFFDDAWVLTNASGVSGTSTWNHLTTAGTAPQRYLAAFGYNGAKNKFFLFGGSDSTGQTKMDLWLLSNANGVGGTAATWSTVQIAGTAPSVRGSMASAYDETSDTLILFGGGACSGTACTLYNETWLISSLTTAPTWQKINPNGTLPPALANLSAVYDPAKNCLVIFGGNASTANPPDPLARVDDTWVLSNVIGSGIPAWSQLTTTIAPPARGGHSAVFDSTNNRMIVFGGVGTENYVGKDVWILANPGDTSPTWAEYLTGTPQPPARGNHAAVYTGTGKNRMIVFGGATGGGTFTNDTWVLRNANGIPSSTVSAITIKGGSVSVCNGYTIQLTPVATDAAGNEVSGVLFIWSTSNPAAATVIPTGLVTGTGAGSATITAGNGVVSGSLAITIKLPPTTPGGGGGGSTLSIVEGQTLSACFDTNAGITSVVNPQTLIAFGGAPLSGYTWTISSLSAFPSGTTVSSLTGVFKGTGGRFALAPGSYTFKMDVSDGTSSASGTITLIVEEANSFGAGGIPGVGCPDAVFQQSPSFGNLLPSAKAGSPYGASLWVMGGTPPYTWSLATGTLPPGLSVDASKGVVRGTPFSSASGQTFQFTVKVTDAMGETAITPSTYRITVQ
jgi:hypothetical protein